MSSYILGDSWPERPSWTRYMKESTYRHDFGTTKQANLRRTLPNTYNDLGYDTRYYRPNPRWQARDDMRIPITQNANYNQGPYTDRDRDYLYYQNGRNDDRPLYSDRPGYRGFERYDGLHTDRPRYDRFDDRNGPSDRRLDPYDNRGSDMYGGRGAMTDRGDYGRGRMEDRYEGPRETNRSPERYRYGERPANYEQADIYDKYGNNRTTQKDYGDFNQQRVRAPVDRPHAYRGKVDEEIDAFHNKAHKGNSRPDSLATLSTVDGPLIDELYLRPEEMKVRHRNMEYAYDQQQRLPLNIAPQRDYKHNIQRPDPTESGAYLFIRANKNNFHEIKTSFQKHKSVLHLSGVLKGIALNNKISVLDDFTNWNITQPIRKRGDVFYDQAPRNKGKEYSTDYMMVCLWFPSVEQARKWIDYDKDFQNAQFPDHNGVDMLIVPINYLPSNDVDHNTFVLTEYQDVVDKEGLNRYVREPIDDILRKDSNFKGCDPFVVWTEDVKQRRLIVSPRSFVSIHRFNSINQAMDYVTDERVERIKRELRGITRSGRQTTVIFQLGDFV